MIPFILLISLTLLNLLSPLAVLAQARSGAPFLNPNSVNYDADIDEFLNAGAQYYIAWQFSGDKSNPIENDAYSFYKGGPTCDILKAKAAKYPGRIGVNIHALANKSAAQITDVLTSAKNDCGTSIVRFWGFDNADNVVKVLRIVNSLGLKAVVALVDFGTIASNPVGWYTTDYKSVYQAHTLAVANAITSTGLRDSVYALELANEPHCFGLTACLTPYNSWARDMSSLLANKGFNIGIGQKANENTTRGDSPGAGSPPDFQASNNFFNIAVTSGHYYNPNEKALVLQALEISKSLVKEFYIGEAGSTGETSAIVATLPPKRPAPTFIPCPDVTSPEFHPLRPYPGSPCDPLIPRSQPPASEAIPKANQDFATQLSQDYKMRNRVAFSCGNSLTPQTSEQFDQASPRGAPQDTNTMTCSQSGNHVTCDIKENFDIGLDLTDANIPILGNTQTQGLTDAQKMTEYLSWFLNGTVQQSEQDPNPSINRLVNFSGPLQKLLPAQFKEFIKNELTTGPGLAKPIPAGQYHNYLVQDPTRLKDLAGSVWSQLFRDIPFSSLEDTTGEVVITATGSQVAGMQDPDVYPLSVKMTIKPNP